MIFDDDTHGKRNYDDDDLFSVRLFPNDQYVCYLFGRVKEVYLHHIYVSRIRKHVLQSSYCYTIFNTCLYNIYYNTPEIGHKTGRPCANCCCRK